MHTIIPSDQNKILREIAREIPVSEITRARIAKLIAEMKTLLSQEKHGVALAAPQVGESVRLFIVSGRALAQRENDKEDNIEIEAIQEATPLGSSEDQVYINPQMLKLSRAKEDKHEGCLSIRDRWGMVPRAQKATIRAYDERGRLFTRGASGFLAHIFQHEMDHLDGVLYIDKATSVYDEKPSDEK